ncbi:MAG TPA: DNA repair protein RecO [Pyrinomonadaceae bacterium]|jgi:DNA repair protein RecO (recombination protein O)
MGLVDTEAFILRTYKLAEADKIVICLTRDAGVVRGVARGARRLKSRFGASLEPFTLISLSFYAKEGKELVSLRQAEILRSYFALARNPETVAALEYLSELALEFAPPHEPNEKLFRMVRACLEAIAEVPERTAPVVRYYELWVLKLSGFLPELRACGGCGKSFDASETLYLSPESSLRCGLCTGETGLALRAEARTLWGQMKRLGPKEWAQKMSEEISRGAQTELGNLSHRLIARALERTPRGQVPLGAASG